jgi:hypothetical protein
MKILERFNDYSGIIEAGGGYGDVCKVDRDRLIELVSRLPAGDIRVTITGHKDGNAILMKPASELNPYWYALAPTAKEEKIRDEIVFVPCSLHMKKGGKG